MRTKCEKVAPTIHYGYFFSNSNITKFFYLQYPYTMFNRAVVHHGFIVTYVEEMIAKKIQYPQCRRYGRLQMCCGFLVDCNKEFILQLRYITHIYLIVEHDVLLGGRRNRGEENEED